MTCTYLVTFVSGEEITVEIEKPPGYHPSSKKLYDAARDAATKIGGRVLSVGRACSSATDGKIFATDVHKYDEPAEAG